MDLSILVADDQANVRQAVSRLLLAKPEVARVGEAEDGAEALDLCRAQPWDVIVLDVAMPRLNGIEALTTLKQERPALPVVMLSTHTYPMMVQQCLKLGAGGFVAKESAFDALMPAIRAVVAGDTYLCRIVQASLQTAQAPLQTVH